MNTTIEIIGWTVTILVVYLAARNTCKNIENLGNPTAQPQQTPPTPTSDDQNLKGKSATWLANIFSCFYDPKEKRVRGLRVIVVVTGLFLVLFVLFFWLGKSVGHGTTSGLAMWIKVFAFIVIILVGIAFQRQKRPENTEKNTPPKANEEKPTKTTGAGVSKDLLGGLKDYGNRHNVFVVIGLVIAYLALAQWAPDVWVSPWQNGFKVGTIAVLGFVVLLLVLLKKGKETETKVAGHEGGGWKKALMAVGICVGLTWIAWHMILLIGIANIVNKPTMETGSLSARCQRHSQTRRMVVSQNDG